MGGAASFMWFSTNIAKFYDVRTGEEKVKPEYLKVFDDLWGKYDKRCFNMYLEEVNDDQHDNEHVS